MATDFMSVLLACLLVSCFYFCFCLVWVCWVFYFFLFALSLFFVLSCVLRIFLFCCLSFAMIGLLYLHNFIRSLANPKLNLGRIFVWFIEIIEMWALIIKKSFLVLSKLPWGAAKYKSLKRCLQLLRWSWRTTKFSSQWCGLIIFLRRNDVIK